MIACINGCAVVNAPAKLGNFAAKVDQVKAKVKEEVQKLSAIINKAIERLDGEGQIRMF